MSWIGYSDSGFADLESVIGSEKQKLLSIVDTFTEVENAISQAWIGEDADAYKEDLRRVVDSTRNSIDTAFTSLSNQLRTTYEDWVNKQKAN